MENVKFTVRMLAAHMKESIEDLAEHSGINVNHLVNVSAGRTKMTGDDVIKLSAYTGIPATSIEV